MKRYHQKHLLDHKLELIYNIQFYSFKIDTPQGFACLIITTPIFFGRDLEIVNAAKISL